MRITRANEAKLMRDNLRLKRQTEELNAKLEYVAMMADVDLDMEEEDDEDVLEDNEMV